MSHIQIYAEIYLYVRTQEEKSGLKMKDKKNMPKECQKQETR